MSFIDYPSLTPCLRKMTQSFAKLVLIILFTVTSTTLLHGLTASFAGTPYLILLVLPANLIAIIFGFWPGIAATVSAVIYTDLFLLNSIESGWITNAQDMLRLGAMLINGIFVSLLSESAKQYKNLKAQIAARESAEDQLTRAEERLRLFIKHSPMALAMLDRNMCYLQISQRWLNDYGLVGHDILGKSHYEIFPMIPERWREFHQRTLAGETHKAEENRFEQPDGTVQWLRSEMVPWYVDQHTIGGLIIISKDITEKKQLEIQLMEETKRLTSLINSFSEEIWLIDANGQLQAVNAVGASKFGVTPGEKIDLKNFTTNLEIYRADGTPRPAEEAPPLKVLQTGKAILNQEEMVKVPGSQEFNYRSVSATPIFDTEGNLSEVLAVVRDITEQKHIARQLENIRLLMQEGERIAHLGSWEYSLATQGMVWSDEKFRIYGLDPANGSPSYETMLSIFIHPEDSFQFNENFQTSVSEQKPFAMEHRIVKPNGDIRWVLDQAHPYFDEQGQLIRYVGTTLDITDRKKTQRALLESEQRWQFALEGAGDGLWDWNTETNKVFFSSQWKKMLGFLDDDIGDSLDEWERRVHPDDIAAVNIEIDKLLTKKIPIYNSEHRIRCKDGNYKWILDRGKVITWTSEGKPLRVIGTHSDITARKIAEQTKALYESQLKQQRSRLEATTHLQIAAQTASAIAHELNQPLTAIVAYSAIAKQLLDLNHVDSDELRMNIEKTQRLAQHAGQSIREILLLLNKSDPPDEVIDCRKVIDDAIAIINADGELGHFRIKQSIEPKLRNLRVNHLSLEKILINLFRNAIQAMRDRKLSDGCIDVIAKTKADEPDLAQITVRDYGIGLDAESLELVFHPFHSTKSSGLGLGLTIGRSLIEASGGKIWAESNDGPGVSIHLTLPFA